MKYKTVTLGCRTNQYESAAYEKQLKELGYSEAGQDEEAEICIVNTCTVTESADSHSRHQIRNLKRKHPNSKLVVTGCLAEKLPPMEEVDLVVLNKDKENLLKQALDVEELPEFAIDQFGGHKRAFVKVQDGCNSFCTYCIIPYVRGRSRSRQISEVIPEVEGLVASGYKEVVITGINVGDFDGGGNLADLVRAVDQVEGLERLRISSIDPDEVDDDLLDAVINGRTTCHSMHIVLQSGSNAMLKRMNRKYTRQMFMETIHRLRAASPTFEFTTDVIVGFPGETEADFEDTLELIREVRFAKVHMFPYSRRDRTRAALYRDQISSQLMQERKQKVLRLAEEVAFSLRQDYVGKTMKVLMEDENSGLTENFLRVNVSGKPNTIIEVLLEENTPEGLKG